MNMECIECMRSRNNKKRFYFVMDIECERKITVEYVGLEIMIKNRKDDNEKSM